jgi:hypothetical protein
MLTSVLTQTVVAGLLPAMVLAQGFPLSYRPDGTLVNPVVYSNDGDNDVRPALAYVASLASSGKIRLVGIVGDAAMYSLEGAHYKAECKTPLVPFDCRGHAENLYQQYQQLVALYQRSGMSNIPAPTRGPRFVLEKPASGRFEATQPTCVSVSRSTCTVRGSDAARMIVEAASKASVEVPLVVLTGGGLTAVAEAYTLEPTVAERMLVIAHVGGEWPIDGKLDTPAYNDYVDLWAMAIVVAKMRTVLFPEPVSEQTRIGPRLTDADIESLRAVRDVELFRLFLRQRQYTKRTVNHVRFIPNDTQYTGDGSPAVLLALPEMGQFVTNVRRGYFSGFRQLPGKNPDSDGINQYPIVELSDTAKDRIWVVMGGSPVASRNEVLRALVDARAFAGAVTVQAPWGGCSGATGEPMALPGTRGAVDFDWGGEGVAMHEEETMHWPMYRLWSTKDAALQDGAGDVIGDLVEGTETLMNGEGGCASASTYVLTNLVSGEYREYTVSNAVAADYAVSVHARSANGGAARFELREANANEATVASSAVLNIPAGTAMVTLPGGAIMVPAGIYRLRLVSLSGSVDVEHFTLALGSDPSNSMNGR